MEKFLELLSRDVFEDTPKSDLLPETKFRELDEWDSLSTMLLIGLFDTEYNKALTGQDIESCNTLEDLYNKINM